MLKFDSQSSLGPSTALVSVDGGRCCCSVRCGSGFFAIMEDGFAGDWGVLSPVRRFCGFVCGFGGIVGWVDGGAVFRGTVEG